jgi:hypothetical protein
MTTIVIVEKTGVLKNLTIKEYSEEELYKKCGFKKADDFGKQTEWNIKMDGKKYLVSLYGKIDGKANTENKYDFPPPVDSTLLFGNCALVCQKKNETSFELCSMSSELWEKMYEKLFGGFENLAVTCVEDEEEVDELENVPAEKKTKNGYLKDGFVVDSGDEDEDYETEDSEEMGDSEDVGDEDEEEINLEDIGSELSEDDYDYSDDDEDDGGDVKENVFVNIGKKKD